MGYHFIGLFFSTTETALNELHLQGRASATIKKDSVSAVVLVHTHSHSSIVATILLCLLVCSRARLGSIHKELLS